MSIPLDACPYCTSIGASERRPKQTNTYIFDSGLKRIDMYEQQPLLFFQDTRIQTLVYTLTHPHIMQSIRTFTVTQTPARSEHKGRKTHPHIYVSRSCKVHITAAIFTFPFWYTHIYRRNHERETFEPWTHTHMCVERQHSLRLFLSSLLFCSFRSTAYVEYIQTHASHICALLEEKIEHKYTHTPVYEHKYVYSLSNGHKHTHACSVCLHTPRHGILSLSFAHLSFSPTHTHTPLIPYVRNRICTFVVNDNILGSKRSVLWIHSARSIYLHTHALKTYKMLLSFPHTHIRSLTHTHNWIRTFIAIQ